MPDRQAFRFGRQSSMMGRPAEISHQDGHPDSALLIAYNLIKTLRGSKTSWAGADYKNVDLAVYGRQGVPAVEYFWTYISLPILQTLDA